MLKNAPFPSHTEGFILAILEEIYTNHLAAKRTKENNKSSKM